LILKESDSIKTGISLIEQVYAPDTNEIVHGVEVFRNYMALLVEKN